jgi:hydrogenase maturation protease
MKDRQITIMGIGNILFTDEGVGIRVIERLQDRYDFPKNVLLLDGGVLGLGLLGFMVEADDLVVVDTVRNGGPPGTLYRLEGDEVPRRFLDKTSIHEVDFLEALTACEALDKVPKTVIIGIEPEDIDSLSIELTPTIEEQMGPLMEMVLRELIRLGVGYTKKGADNHVPGHSCQNCQD